MKQRKLVAVRLFYFLLSKPKHLGFRNYELSKLFMYNLFSYDLQLFFGKSTIKSPCMDIDLLVKSFETDDLVTVLKIVTDNYDMFDFSNLDFHNEIFDEADRKLPNEIKTQNKDTKTT